MDSSLTLGGFLGGFLLAGILLPIAVSFVVDGAVVFFRGRGPTRLLVSALVVIAIISLYPIALQNADDAGAAQQMQGAVGLILWFSIPAAVVGLAIRMMALILNPHSKAIDQEAIVKREARHAAHGAAPERTSHA
ncbi:MAG TPA: hypothetical protein VHZ81_14465 [Galbitalea sp.]|jgi:hypothetical protein|nr:hypothetical protein [Galbitalea sp.]